MICGNSFVTSVLRLYVFLFLKKRSFWYDMLCPWVNIWRSTVPPCSGSNTPRRLDDYRKSSKVYNYLAGLTTSQPIEL